MYGIAYWAAVVGTPFCGALGKTVGAKWMFICSSVLQALSAFLFGAMNYVQDKVGFLAGSYISRQSIYFEIIDLPIG